MYSLGDLILCCLISAAIGYFWAIWRVDNIKVHMETENIIKVDMDKFWRKAEEWRAKQEK